MVIKKTKFNKEKHALLCKFTFLFTKQKGIIIKSEDRIEILDQINLPENINENGFDVLNYAELLNTNTFTLKFDCCFLNNGTSYYNLSKQLYIKVDQAINSLSKSNLKKLLKANYDFKFLFNLINAISKNNEGENFFLYLIEENKSTFIFKEMQLINEKVNNIEFSLNKDQNIYYMSKNLINYTDNVIQGVFQEYTIKNVHLYVLKTKDQIDLKIVYPTNFDRHAFYEDEIKEKHTNNEIFFNNEEIENYRIKFIKDLFNENKEIFIKSIPNLNEVKKVYNF